MSGMSVAVIGAGAMGGLYGGLLASRPGNRVLLIDLWREHVAAINGSGLLIEAAEGPMRVMVQAAETARGLEPKDLVVILVKSRDTEAAARAAESAIGPETMVLSLQNGLGNIEILSEALGASKVIGGSTSFGAFLKGPGVIAWRGRGQTPIGELDGRVTDRIGTLAEVFQDAGLGPVVSTNVEGVIWTKLIVNVGINALAAILGVPNGGLLEDSEAASTMEAAVLEAAAVAAASGVRLEVSDPVAHVRDVCLKTGQNICSTMQDLRARRPTEIGVINGAVVKAGLRLGLDVQVNQRLWGLIQAQEAGF